jgi:hypothetical protein
MDFLGRALFSDCQAFEQGAGSIVKRIRMGTITLITETSKEALYRKHNAIGLVSTHGFCKRLAYMAQISIFRGSLPHLVATHLAVFGGFAPISPHIRVRRLPCE